MKEKENKVYAYEDALAASMEYFSGDELAARAFLDKYALRDNDLNLLENTPKDMHRRMAKEFARIQKKKYSGTGIKPLSEDEIFAYFDKFQKIVPQGSPMYGVGNVFQFISLSNCFVIESPADSYGGICKADEELVQISKRRGGVGGDITEFRPSGAITHNAAHTSTGLIPLMSRYSNSIREVGQNGRRGALMLSVDIHHPESVKPKPDGFVGEQIVVNKGDTDGREIHSTTEWYDPKDLDFATVKYDAKMVTGANISIRLSDEFLTAVDNNTDFEQRWPTDVKNPVISKQTNANKAWKKIVRSAWQMAEPGLLFWDNILRESPADCYAKFGFRTLSTNPCGEIPLSAYDSCRLMVVNLFSFVVNPFTKKAYFDYESFYETVKVIQRLMDDLIDLEIEKIEQIIEKIGNDPEDEEIKSREKNLWKKMLKACKNGRRTGTGITALGDTLAALDIGYGSDEGIEETERIYQTLKFGAYASSVEMAKELGAFPIWDHELEKDNPFLNRIENEFVILAPSNVKRKSVSKEHSYPVIDGKKIYADMKKYGRRNIALLTTAPTGTVSLQTQTSSGIEPQFSIAPYTRRKKGNPGDVNFRTDYVDQNGDNWMEFPVYPPKVQKWIEISGETDLAKSPWAGSCAKELVWTQRVKLQAAAQRHVDHSISSTINLPADVTVDQVDEIYRTAWKAGCKGITIYRDGCRSGVLIENNSKKQKKSVSERPETLPCDVYHIKAKGEEYFVLVGLLDGEPYEVFAGKNGMIAKNIHTGTLVHRAKKYDAVFEDGVLTDVAEYLSDEEEAITRMVSTALQSPGVDINVIVHRLQKTKGNLFGFARAMARALGTYVKDKEEKLTGEVCPNCNNNLIRQEGCIKCPGCSFSKCG